MSRLKSLMVIVFLVAGFQFCNPTVVSAQNAELEALKLQIEEATGMDLAALLERLDEGFQAYERQLQAVLRTRLLEEKEFIARVIFLVQEEGLPKNLVDSAWLWVRKNRAGTPYPFVYFERVLRLEAEKAGVFLPSFDRTIYTDRSALRERRLQQRRLQEQQLRTRFR